jgi:hypothetical protein
MFARVGAVVALTVEDYYAQKKRWWLRLGEKNGKVNEMPCHHLSIARSNSANAPTICIIIRPAGVVVSTASVRGHLKKGKFTYAKAS